MKHKIKALPAIFAGLLATALAIYAQNDGSPPQSASAVQPVQKTASPEQPKSEKNKIAFDQLPQPVQQSVRKNAHDSRVSDVNQANLDGETVYNVTLDNHGKLSKYTFDKNGKALAEPGRPIPEAAGAQPNHSKQPDTDEQHNHRILQHPK